MVVQGSVTTIRDVSLGDISHTDDPSSQVVGNSFNMSATNSVLPEQNQTLQFNGTVSQEKLPLN